MVLDLKEYIIILLRSDIMPLIGIGTGVKKFTRQFEGSKLVNFRLNF